jgi:hypothetical protein
MTTTPAHVDLARALKRACDDLIEVHAGLSRLVAAVPDGGSDAQSGQVETGVKHPLQQPLNAPKTREEVQAEHRRAHRSGRPGKIEGDPELEAFILAQIDTLTFAQIVSEVRATFPPARHCSHSGLGR